MTFEFATAGRIVFGAGAADGIGAAAREFGRHALVVCGRSPERAARIEQRLAPAVASTRFVVAGEPDLGAVRAGVAHARAAGCDLVVGVGGGSAIDAGKAIAAILTNDGDVLDYLEVIGDGRPLVQPPAPFIAVPTTAGTGSEVTRNAVLGSAEHRVKASLRSPLMLPRLAIVDPDLTMDLPAALTAATGLDALTQLIEPYLSSKATPMTDALAVAGMRRAAGALRRAVRDAADRDARASMALASLWSGMALANAGLGAVHGLAAPIGGAFPAPHGAVCAALLPVVFAANVQALRARAPQSPALARADEVARLLTGRPSATADDGSAWLRTLASDLGIPGLSRYGITRTDAADLASKAMRASSMKGNPIVLSLDEIADIVTRAL